MNHQKFCAVIPAAGRGSRLNLSVPKVFVPVFPHQTIWHILYEKLKDKVNHIHLVLSQDGAQYFNENIKNLADENFISYSIQKKPIGMGDAIFGGYDDWCKYQNILIIWGDQVFISDKTLSKTLLSHDDGAEQKLTMPLVHQERPYVEYRFSNDQKQLLKVYQTREGDICKPNGLSDVGIFCLTTKRLLDNWQEYLSNAKVGNHTQEINFLPFLPYLSLQHNWQVQSFVIDDAREARGVNTQDDLRDIREWLK